MKLFYKKDQEEQLFKTIENQPKGQIAVKDGDTFN